MTAFALSAFIYLTHFEILEGVVLKLLNSLLALIGFYLLLSGDKKRLFWSGFFIGNLWFYWIGFSFRYYDATMMIPFMMLFVGLGYGLIFWVIGIFTSPFVRALFFVGLSFIHPLKFNWLMPELTLLDSFFGVSKWQFALFLTAIALFIVLQGKQKAFGSLLLIAAINFSPALPLPLSTQKIYLSDTATPQDLKWQEKFLQESIQKNLNIIYDAIGKKYDIVVLSESAFAMFLNLEPDLLSKLQELSKEITIVTGGLYADEHDAYNSTYYFVEGTVHIAHKVLLVPFGEEIPLPKILKDWINEKFYNGAEDYKTADNPTDVLIKGEHFRNAICYEATREELYDGSPKFMIATSNNGWFTPSIEPTLQRLLLRYYSQKYKTVIYHSANKGGTGVIH